MSVCIIASLTYSPGLVRHIELLETELAARGVSVVLLLAEEYSLQRLPVGGQIVFTGRSRPEWRALTQCLRADFHRELRATLARLKPEVVVVYNPHPANGLLFRYARRTSSSVATVAFLHEPFTPRKRLYGIAGVGRQMAVEWFQTRLVDQSDAVVLPSPLALSKFRHKYPRARVQIHQANLLISDKQPVLDGPKPRQFFTLVGMVNRATGLPQFIQLARECERRCLPYKFRLITSTDISRLFGRANRRPANLTVQCGKPLSDDDIDQAIRESVAVFRFDADITQSGVIPVAYMWGTPVIAPDLPGFRQHVRQGVDGLLFPPNANPSHLIPMMDRVIGDPSLGLHAREFFDGNFSPKAWASQYGWLVKAASGNAAH